MCSSAQTRNNVGDDGTGAYLCLRKDNIAIPKEFYKTVNQQDEDSELEFENKNIRKSKRHPFVPPLNLPRNAVEELK
jgi:hypothetical protein